MRINAYLSPCFAQILTQPEQLQALLNISCFKVTSHLLLSRKAFLLPASLSCGRIQLSYTACIA